MATGERYDAFITGWHYRLDQNCLKDMNVPLACESYSNLSCHYNDEVIHNLIDE